uniref:Uncharacterized protein n=1 Tax=Arundo donax TaxID=35708 RepID=A0A0A9FNU1_ARUDO
MCGALMPGHGETITDEAIWERLPVRDSIFEVKAAEEGGALGVVLCCLRVLLGCNFHGISTSGYFTHASQVMW